MIKLIPSVFLLVICFVTSFSLSAQERFIEEQSYQNEVKVFLNSIDLEENEHIHSLVGLHIDHDHEVEEDHMHNHNYITMSLDEIISSDDIIDFNCTGGFCMKKSHTHKKGLSTQRQLFDYFMRIST